jgi:hypothetical protein
MLMRYFLGASSPASSFKKFKLEESHDDDLREVPRGNVHGSGRFGAGNRDWSNGTESKPQRQPKFQQQYVAIRNTASLSACARGGRRRLLRARRDGAHW